MWREDEVRS